MLNSGRMYQLFTLLIAGFILASCSAAPMREADRFYGLNINIEAVSFGSDETVLVKPVQIRGVQSGRPLVIAESQSPLKLIESRGHFWHTAPNYLIRDALASGMDNAATDMRFRTDDLLNAASYSLHLSVKELNYQMTGTAVVSAQAALKSRNGAVLFTGEYRQETEMTAQDDPAAAVLALEKGLTIIAGQLARDIAATLAN